MTLAIETDRAGDRTALLKDVLEVIKTVGLALLIALVLRIVLFQPYTIPSASMEPGLRVGDYIVVSKFSYGWSRHSIPFGPPLFRGRLMGQAPARGDVVVFALPRKPSETWIKRVIGLPGDRVQLQGGAVWVNGAPIVRTAMGVVRDPAAGGLPVLQYRETMAGGRDWLTFDQGPGRDMDDTGVIVVPQGQYLVLGDNRDNSLDGRFPRAVGVGFLPAENLKGKAQFVLASWRPGASLFKPWTWVTHLDLGRFFRPIR